MMPESISTTDPALNAQTPPPIEENKSTFSQRKSISNPFKQITSYLTKSESRKTYTLMTLTFAFISLLIFFAILPTLLSITQIVKKIDEYKVVKSQQDDKINTIASLSKQAENSTSAGGLNEYVRFLDESFIPNGYIQEVIYKDIAIKTQQAGIVLDTLKTNGGLTSEVDNTKAAQYTISVRSDSLQKIQTFVQNLSSSKIIYRILKVEFNIPTASQLQSSSSSNDPYPYISTINIISFYYV